MTGNVVGVVEGQLNAINMMRSEGSVPQNVNFAIQAAIVVNFLSAKGITPKLDTRGGGLRQELTSADVADLTKKFTVQVSCEANPAKAARGSLSGASNFNSR
jgi:hypothetical protein